MKKLIDIYADFETTKVLIPDTYKNQKDYYDNHPNPDTPKIYSWGITGGNTKEFSSLSTSTSKKKIFNEETIFYYGINGSSFIDFIETINFDARIYFNNLKGFDGHFLLPELDKAGYTNVLPFDINELDELPEDLKTEYFNRYTLIKYQILENDTIYKEYNDLKTSEPEYAERWIKRKINKRWNFLQPKEYSILTDENKNIYEVKIGLKSLKTTKGVHKNRALIIRDNLLLFPSSIAKMGETIVQQYHGVCKHYKGGECKDEASRKELENLYLKKDLSSSYERTELFKNFKELENEGNELEYLFQDTYILYKFHTLLEKTFPRKDWKLTIGSTVYKEWIKEFGTTIINRLINNEEVKVVKLNRGITRYEYNKKLYTTTKLKQIFIEKLLPTNWLDSKYSDEHSFHEELYKWFDGGITRVNEDYRGQLVDNITFIDINSDYPYQMSKDVLVPYGVGVRGNVKGYDFKFYTLRPLKTIKNETGLPFLHNNFADKREYLKVLKPGSEYKFTSITYKRFLEYYKAKPSDYSLTVDFSFKQIPISTYFNDFILPWYDIKEQASANGNEIMKMIAKLFMNNLFGKFGTKSERTSSYWNQVDEDWGKFTQTINSKFYLPLGIVITELGRMELVDAVGHKHNQFVYCDTDSIAFKDFNPKEFENIFLHPTQLGAWDIEYDNAYGIFRRPKQYMLLNDSSKPKLAFAGINFNRLSLPDEEVEEYDETLKLYQKLTLKDMVYGATIENQLSTFKLIGKGIVFNEIDKNIKPVWDYEPLTEQKHFLPEHFHDTKQKLNKLKRISL